MTNYRWVQRCASAEARVTTVGREYENEYRCRVRCAEAAHTCSEDEAVAKGLCLYSQGPTSASGSTSLTAMSGLHTPWSYNMGCWLLLLVEAGAASCRQSVGGSAAGVMAVGLLLLIEMGQSMRTVAESSFCFQESSKARPAHAQKMLSFGAQPLKRPSG